MIIVEYEIAGTSLATGRHASARFVGLLRVRDGQVAAWREYQATRAFLAALQP